MSTPEIPDEAVRLAAEAIEDASMRMLGRDLGTLHRDEIVRDGIAAAYPAIETAVREKIASEIESANTYSKGTWQWADYEYCASVARGGTS